MALSQLAINIEFTIKARDWISGADDQDIADALIALQTKYRGNVDRFINEVLTTSGFEVREFEAKEIVTNACSSLGLDQKILGKYCEEGITNDDIHKMNQTLFGFDLDKS